MRVWKISFWVAFFLLVITNLFWVYQLIDNAVGHQYYKVSCEEYQVGSENFQTVLNSFKKKADLVEFLNKLELEFEEYNKAKNENYIVVGSASVEFNDQGIIKK